MPKFSVITWSAYDFTKIFMLYKSKGRSQYHAKQWVMIEVESTYFFKSKDNNHVLASRACFEVIKYILEIDNVTFRVSLFKCKQIDSNISVKTDEL